jgi:hypothetical protein
MGHIKYASDVGAPVEVAFSYADNHLFVPDWLFGVAAFEPLGDADQGLGARYAATLQFGLWHPAVECEVTEYRRNAVIGYTIRRRRPRKTAPAVSERPVLATLTFRFDPLGRGRAVLTAEADYPDARSLPGRLCGTIVTAIAHSAVRRSESQLCREIEGFHGTDLVGRTA